MCFIYAYCWVDHDDWIMLNAVNPGCDATYLQVCMYAGSVKKEKKNWGKGIKYSNWVSEHTWTL